MSVFSDFVVREVAWRWVDIENVAELFDKNGVVVESIEGVGFVEPGVELSVAVGGGIGEVFGKRVGDGSCGEATFSTVRVDGLDLLCSIFEDGGWKFATVWESGESAPWKEFVIWV